MASMGCTLTTVTFLLSFGLREAAAGIGSSSIAPLRSLFSVPSSCNWCSSPFCQEAPPYLGWFGVDHGELFFVLRMLIFVLLLEVSVPESSALCCGLL